MKGIILAGGKGLRMNSHIPKQYMVLDDKPILIHTTEVFLCSNLFDTVYVVIENEWEEYTKELLINYFSETQLNTIQLYPCKSLSRTYSLFQAIKYIVNKSEISNNDIAIIHDADRPFVSKETLNDCIIQTKKYKATLALAPAVETMYRIEKNGFLGNCIKKEEVGVGQSPFGSQLNLLHRLLNSYSTEELIDPMTISQLYLGRKIPIKFCNGSINNFKITTMDDLIYAEYIKKNFLR